MSTVVITGIGKGIGRALAEKFVSEGFNVIGTSRSGKTDVAGTLVFELDLSDAESIKRTAHAIHAEVPVIDILINNAGVLLDEDETTLRPELLRGTLEVNLLGTVAFTEALKNYIVQDGHIVNISSTAGSLALADGSASHFPHHYPAYKISKTALNMYTRTLAVELSGKAIVSSVHPGWVQTDMGGPEANITPAEAAEGIFTVAISAPETGQFWFKGEKLPW
ncbi:MAG: SDR family NAD(P)-dependent oxidoreductase [Candidatus Parcubacteria bacterium]|nr:SDR family NAD(P)-dependent oxidoreductase [Candidatus Parcubacteria bacterium]